MKLEILAMGKVKDKRCRALVSDYMDRLGHYLPSAETSLRESKRTAKDVEAGLKEEAAEMAKRCSSRTIKVAMDERGEQLTSVALAKRIERWMVRGEHHVAFMIGSAHGLDPSWRAQADLVLALSPMTFPHELARVMLAEQLYRAMTIVRGEPYHKV